MTNEAYTLTEAPGIDSRFLEGMLGFGVNYEIRVYLFSRGSKLGLIDRMIICASFSITAFRATERFPYGNRTHGDIP